MATNVTVDYEQATTVKTVEHVSVPNALQSLSAAMQIHEVRDTSHTLREINDLLVQENEFLAERQRQSGQFAYWQLVFAVFALLAFMAWR